MDVSIIIPTLNGGAKLRESIAVLTRQKVERSYEIICVDSGSSEADLAALKSYPIRLERIDKKDFNHGLTRDLGARLARGTVLVFLNQDAVPCEESWLRRISETLFASDEYAAVQGGLQEVPDFAGRFYWGSVGRRFYFTRESDRWITRHSGIGFSTINVAIRRSVWEQHPFGFASIMEDKKWEREVVRAGYKIAVCHAAAVFHSHTYDLRSLIRRCQSEGFGWRTLGERYSFWDMIRDLVIPWVYVDWLRGLVLLRIRTWAEFLFPWVRPIMVYYGNRQSEDVRTANSGT